MNRDGNISDQVQLDGNYWDHTQDTGNTYGDGESTDGENYGPEYKSGVGMVFDFDF